MSRGYKKEVLAVLEEGMLDDLIHPVRKWLVLSVTRSTDKEVKEMVAAATPAFRERVKDAIKTYQEEMRTLKTNKRIMEIHRNSGFSMSWLRTFNAQLKTIGLDITHKKVADFAMANTHHYSTWPELFLAIDKFIKSGEASQRSLVAYEAFIKNK